MNQAIQEKVSNFEAVVASGDVRLIAQNGEVKLYIDDDGVEYIVDDGGNTHSQVSDDFAQLKAEYFSEIQL